MQEVKQKKGIKEFFRKFIVSLKKRTTKIPQFVLIVAFIVYAFSLSTISNTTAYVNKTPMGLCSFVVMLLSVLGFVSSLNAFPVRAKPKILMVILMYVMEVVLIGADIWYFIKIQEGLRENTYTAAALAAINSAKVVIIAHIILVAITILLFALVPVIRKLLNKIDTSVDLGENEDMKKIELEDEN
jgi:lysylphosphatidylglycerol synthetase-like protein (DUF2156 family)